MCILELRLFYFLCSDLQNICLTGKRTDNADRKPAPSGSDNKLNSEVLPFIVTSSNGKQVSQKTVKRKLSATLEEEKSDHAAKTRQDVVRTAPELTKDTVLPCVPSKSDAPHQMEEKPIANSAKHPSADRRFYKERIRLPKFQWTEGYVNNHRTAREKNITTIKVERKEKPIVKTPASSESDENVLLSTRQLNSRGNLHLGSTVLVENAKSRPERVTVGKCEIFSSTNSSSVDRIPKSYQTARKLPSETAFIRILGQQTGPPPPRAAKKNASKDTNKERPNTKEKVLMNQNEPLRYVSRFGRRNFHHVLEARSFKPAEKKLRATALADFHN